MGSFCEKIQKLGKGISTDSRYRIVEALLKGPLPVGEIVRSVKLTQPAVSQHLKTLKSCQIVSDQKRGKEVFYSVNVKHLVYILRCLAASINKCPKEKIKCSSSKV